METYRIIITNSAERPITITELHLAVQISKGPHDSGLRPSVYWATEHGNKTPDLPLTLKDGEMAVFWLSEVVSGKLQEDRRNRLYIDVYDADGRIYSKYSEGEFDPRYGYRTGKIRPLNRFSRMKSHLRAWYCKITRQ